MVNRMVDCIACIQSAITSSNSQYAYIQDGYIVHIQ